VSRTASKHVRLELSWKLNWDSRIVSTEAQNNEAQAMEVGEAVITLVLGGARSGKSRYAQALACGAGDVVFLATAEPCDDDMKARIERHRRERPASWKTVEVPLDLDRAVEQHGAKDCFLLIDCLTTFTANLMMAEGGNAEAILARIDRLCAALAATKSSVAIVSNEARSGVVPAYPSGCQFRDLLGEINQKVARIADNVVLMVAGCPLAVKGRVELRS
jgi:adenosylcobinamide kinase / adenosylcobinamide-phosphate guanylyltransferase